jgi:hypothetical protein
MMGSFTIPWEWKSTVDPHETHVIIISFYGARNDWETAEYERERET